MARLKLLNGLPNDLISSFFSTLKYWGKGYMVDWLVNAGIELNIKTIKIDILNKQIIPKELEIKPLLYHINELEGIILKVSQHAGFGENFIRQATFEIKLTTNRRLMCKAILIGENGVVFSSKEYYDESYENFKVFNLSLTFKVITKI